VVWTNIVHTSTFPSGTLYRLKVSSAPASSARVTSSLKRDTTTAKRLPDAEASAR
jgi:hypothetical protein